MAVGGPRERSAGTNVGALYFAHRFGVARVDLGGARGRADMHVECGSGKVNVQVHAIGP